MLLDVGADEPAGGDDLVAAGDRVVQGVAHEVVRDPPAAQLGRDVGVEEVELPLAGRTVLADRLAAVDHGVVPAFGFVMLYVEVHRLLLTPGPVQAMCQSAHTVYLKDCFLSLGGLFYETCAPAGDLYTKDGSSWSIGVVTRPRDRWERSTGPADLRSTPPDLPTGIRGFPPGGPSCCSTTTPRCGGISGSCSG